MITYLLLFWEFFKTGLFAVGGGLATLPFLYQMAEKYDWFTKDMVADMLAISESTPGPIGINMATYAGFNATGNVFGSLVATFSIILPSLIIITIIAKFLSKYSENRFVKGAFYGVRPIVLAFIVVTAINLIINNIYINGAFNIQNILLFLGLLILSNLKWLKKIHPIVFIALGAVFGIVFSII